MTERAEFRDGERLRADDLNREAASRRKDAEDHETIAHPVRGDRQGLLGASIISAAGNTAISSLPAGPISSVRVDVPDAPGALRLAPGGIRARGPFQGIRASLIAEEPLRLIATTPAPAPAPWTIRALNIRDDENRVIRRELRVELEVPVGSPPSSSRVTLRKRSAAPAADPVFTVDAAGTVTVSGGLDVHGTLSEGPVPADPSDPRFVTAFVRTLVQRILDIAIQPENPSIKLTVTADATSTADRTTVRIGSNPDRPYPLWAAVMEINRQNTRAFRIVRIGGEPTQKVPIAVTTVLNWTVQLAPGTAATITVAVVAFDPQGEAFAQRASLTVPPPPEPEETEDPDDGLEIPA